MSPRASLHSRWRVKAPSIPAFVLLALATTPLTDTAATRAISYSPPLIINPLARQAHLEGSHFVVVDHLYPSSLRCSWRVSSKKQLCLCLCQEDWQGMPLEPGECMSESVMHDSIQC